MDAAAHDTAVALVSHVPQVAATLVAARLAEGPEDALTLTGQGLRDVTRVAASDPDLWIDVLAANADPVAQILTELRADVDGAIAALHELADDPDWGRTSLRELLVRGNAGRARLPGKHGAPPTSYAVVPVVLPDRPGELARLFADAGDAGVNIEDVRIEHSPGQPVGLVELSCRPGGGRAAGRGARRARMGGPRLRPGSLGVSPPPDVLEVPRARDHGPTDRTIVVAVDGPSGSGKSSASRASPRRLGLRYLDTGSMYRAVTWWMLEQGVDVDDADAVGRLRRRAADRGRAPTRTHPRSPSTAATCPPPIRTRGGHRGRQRGGAVPAVRARLVALQREAIGAGGHRRRGTRHRHGRRARRARQDLPDRARGGPRAATRGRAQRRPEPSTPTSRSTELRSRDAIDTSASASPLPRRPTP